MITAKNPILPGFHPDPSICRVGDDYYIVNSSFAYFPGIPIFHSKDLAHWEQIGNVLDRKSQLPLEGCRHSQGLYAPTIRYHEGRFYMICTNVSGGGNFVVYAENPAGPWSEPWYIEGADGIDPSLFFDEDGRCYYIGTHENEGGAKYNGDWYIWIQELDLEKQCTIGEPKNVWNGAMKNVIWPEGPHLYKIGDWYYIMHAEGGTGPEHCIAVCRSKELWGPYENCPRNPIFTHRHLGKDYPIQYVGHGDLVETPEGEWYVVMLAVRPLEKYTTMGRETFLAKVTWEEGWPVVNPGVGILTDEVEVKLPCHEVEREAIVSKRAYDFTNMSSLGPEFLMLRNPKPDMYELTSKGLELRFGKETIREQASPSYVCVRQEHHSFTAKVQLAPQEMQGKECAGIVLMQNNLYNLRLEKNADSVQAILCQDGVDTVLGTISNAEAFGKGEKIELGICVEGLKAFLLAGDKKIAEACVKELSTEVAGGFVGCTVGAYASANGEESGRRAVVTGFSYEV